MAKTTFTGPVVSKNGFIGTLVGQGGGGAAVGPGVVFTAIPSSALPAPTAALSGAVMCVSDNGVSNNEFCLVLCDGTKWTTVTGQPLT